MSAGTLTQSVPSVGGGAPLAAETRIQFYRITAPSGNSQTSFTIAIPGIPTTALIVGVAAKSASAAALAGLWGSVGSVGTLTATFTSTTLAGTEVFDIAVIKDF